MAAQYYIGAPSKPGGGGGGISQVTAQGLIEKKGAQILEWWRALIVWKPI